MARNTQSRPDPRSMLAGGGRRSSRGFGFFREVYSELRKVVWPTREEATRLTMLVLTIAIAFGIALAMVDFIFTEIFGVVLF